MENKKTFKVILITLLVYMLLSWVITAGAFGDEGFVSSGFNQFGIFDFFLAPINLFNYFVSSMTMNIDGYVNSFGYGNIVLAFIAIAILYGTINKTGAYSYLIKTLRDKLSNKKNIFILIVAFIYCVLTSISGLKLILFMFLPFFVTLLLNLKFSRVSSFTATVGAMLIGELGSLFNPNINGLNNIIFHVGSNNNMLIRVIFFIMLMVILLATIFLSNNEGDKEKDILLYEDNKDKKTFVPLIIVHSIVTIILIVCMYNWYYMFDVKAITTSYDSLMNVSIKDYTFMQNIFGMSEKFGYWTGFSMSALLIIESLIIKFIYNIKLDKMLEGIKKGLSDMLPTILLSIVSLSLIVLSLHDSNSFIYSIVNRILVFASGNQILGVSLSILLHSIFINDYFAITSSLSGILTNTYGMNSINLSLLTSQIAHGFASLITPLNVYLVAGLSMVRVSYTDWFKYIWKTLLIILVISIIILVIATRII